MDNGVIVVSIVYGVVLIAFLAGMLGAFFLFVKKTAEEKEKLINALVAKTPEQMRDLEMVKKITIPVPTQEGNDLVPETQLSDDDWYKAVTGEKDGE